MTTPPQPEQPSQPSPTITPKVDYKPLTGSLWCIAAFFNPLGTANRTESFQVFHERMMKHEANVLYAEVALHKRGFQLPDFVGPEYLPVQVCAENILWQKERLLNLLLKHLPDDCDKVCWIDADVLFQSPDWQSDLCEALTKYRLVQGFSWVGMLPGGVDFVDTIKMKTFPVGFNDNHRMFGYIKGLQDPEIFKRTGHTGMVWAARRELLEEVGGFYDESIMGGNDLLMARASTYHHYMPEVVDRHSRFHMAHYYMWAQHFCEAVDNSVSFIDHDLYHVYHGSIPNRNHEARLATMCELEFDPKRDLQVNDEGAWTVTQRGERLVTPTRTFFVSRKDDF